MSGLSATRADKDGSGEEDEARVETGAVRGIAQRPMFAPLWEQTTPQSPELPPLAGDCTVDFLIIGAGIAGLSTALSLAEADRDVMVLERGEPGAGATGKSGGLIAPDFVGRNPSDILGRRGEREGRQLIRLVGESAQDCFSLIARYDMDCDAVQGGFLCPAHDEAAVQAQQSKAEEWRALGYDVAFLDKAEISATLGSDFYRGGLRFVQGGAINPLAFCRSLLAAARRAGADMYAQSPVTRLMRDGEAWLVETPGGRVRARRVVLAANGGNATLHPALKKTILPLTVYEYATEPLSDKLRSAFLHDGAAFTDQQPYLFTGRFDQDGRFISAFPDFLVKRGREGLESEARRRLNRYYPGLADTAIHYLWSGTAWINPSLLPEIYRLGENAFAIQACNGRGIAVNAALGREMAAALMGKPSEIVSVLLRDPEPMRAHSLMRHLPAMIMAFARMKSRLRAQLKGEES